MARILGLDPGGSSVKAVLLETSFRGVSLIARSEVPNADGEIDYAGVAAAIRKDGIAHADQIIAAIPGTGISTQHMVLPFSDQKRISATLGFEVESAIPYDIAETAWDHQILSTSSGKSEILIGSARLDEVSTFLGSLKSAGLDPRALTSSALAYQNLFSTAVRGQTAAGAGATPSVLGILDIGATRCSLCVCRDSGELLCARSFPGGGNDLTAAVAARFEVSLNDAETWKISEANMAAQEDESPEMSSAREALAGALAPIIREIRSTIRACAARFHVTPDKIHLTGGTGQLRGLAEYLTGALGMNIVPYELETKDDFQIEGDGGRFALATALALQGCGGLRSHRFNLRRGALAFKGDLDFFKGKASKLGIFALILAILAGISMGLQWRNVKSREASVDDALFDMTKKVLGKGQKNYDIALNMLRGSGSAGGQLPAYSAVDLFGFLIESAQKVNVKMEDVEAEMDRVKFRGETSGFDSVDSLVTQLESVPCFRKVKRNKVQKSKDGTKIIFELVIDVSCGGAGAEK